MHSIIPRFSTRLFSGISRTSTTPAFRTTATSTIRKMATQPPAGKSIVLYTFGTPNGFPISIFLEELKVCKSDTLMSPYKT